MPSASACVAVMNDGSGLEVHVKVIGVESAGYSAMRQLLAGEEVTVGGDTIAEGIAVRDIGKAPLAIARALVDRVLTVDEVAIERAIALFLEVEKTVAEGAGAAGLAALLAHPEVFAGRKVGLILCGGNIYTRLLASVLLRGLVRDGRIVRLRLMIPDLPGQLADRGRSGPQCVEQLDPSGLAEDPEPVRDQLHEGVGQRCGNIHESIIVTTTKLCS